MGQFKPMVKMETTEPSVELKLKKGGHVSMKNGKGDHGHKKMADGGMPMMPARGDAAPAAAPKRPSLMARRRAMRGLPAGAGPAAPVGQAARMMSGAAPAMPPQAMPPQGMPTMKKGGDTMQDKAMIKKAMKQHDAQEHKGGKGTKLSLKHGGKMATGGVVNGQGGFATGGVVNGQGGFKTGGVANANGGGYKKGGKIKGMMGGGMMGQGAMDDGMMGMYKKGGAPKKAYAAGGTVNSGRPVAMPQGSKKPSPPVSTNRVSGTFKRGGKVGEKRMNSGGPAADAQTARETKGYEDHYKRETAENRAMRDMMNPMNLVRGAVKKLRGLGGVTTTEREVSRTVSPPEKKSGGRIKC